MAKWVRIERKTQGDMNGYHEFNLEDVHRVQVGRKGGFINEAYVFLKASPDMGLVVDAHGIESFMKAWDEHNGTVTKLNEPDKLGVIQLPDTQRLG